MVKVDGSNPSIGSYLILITMKVKTKRDTSVGVAYSMLNFLNFGNLYIEGDCILEPSAGSGNLIRYILSYPTSSRSVPKVENFLACETNHDKVNTLKENKINVIGRDYLSTTLYRKPDFIIACPPFKGNTYISHIQKMYKDLKTGGHLLTLCPASVFTDVSPEVAEFRSDLQALDYSFKVLPDYSFIEKYKSVPTVMLKIYK